MRRFHALTTVQLGQLVAHLFRRAAEVMPKSNIRDGAAWLGYVAPDFEVLEASAHDELAEALAANPAGFGRLYLEVDAGAGEPVGVTVVYESADVRPVLAWARRLQRNRLVCRVGRAKRSDTE